MDEFTTQPYIRTGNPYGGKIIPYKEETSPYSGIKIYPALLQENKFAILLENESEILI